MPERFGWMCLKLAGAERLGLDGLGGHHRSWPCSLSLSQCGTKGLGLHVAGRRRLTLLLHEHG